MKENGEKALLTFDTAIKINKHKTIIAARYKGEKSSEEVYFIPKRESFTPKKGEEYLVYIPAHKYPYYFMGKTIYSVTIASHAMIGKIKVFENIFIEDSLFKEFRETAVIIKYPDYGHDTHLIRIWSNRGKNNENLKRFIKKDLPNVKIQIKNEILEIIIDKSEDPDYLKKDFLERLSRFTET